MCLFLFTLVLMFVCTHSPSLQRHGNTSNSNTHKHTGQHSITYESVCVILTCVCNGSPVTCVILTCVCNRSPVTCVILTCVCNRSPVTCVILTCVYNRSPVTCVLLTCVYNRSPVTTVTIAGLLLTNYPS